MISDWPIARRVAVAAVVALSVGVLLATLVGGLSPSYPVKVMQLIATVLAAIIVVLSLTALLVVVRGDGDDGDGQGTGGSGAVEEQAGLRLPARIVGVEPVEVSCGLRVRAELEALPGGDFTVPVFRPVGAPEAAE